MKKKWPVMMILVFAVLILWTIVTMTRVSEKSREEQLSMVRDAVQRAALTCFAVEGTYPDDVQYLREHYGLCYDEDVYLVRYECWAENQFPDITVVERK